VVAFLESTPKAFGVVAGSPAGSIFARLILNRRLKYSGLGKLPRPPQARGCAPQIAAART